MKLDERTITTLELSEVDETALTLTRHLLDEIEAKLFKSNDVIESADTNETIERDDLYITRDMLDILLNDGHPTRWERHD